MHCVDGWALIYWGNCLAITAAATSCLGRVDLLMMASMYSIPLSTKLHKPATGRTLIARPRLLRFLDDGLEGKVTLISAPAGFGKSTLVSQWLDKIKAMSSESVAEDAYRAAWLSLDEGDNALPQFVTSVTAAIEKNYRQCCQIVSAILREQTQPSVETLTDGLVTCLEVIPGSQVLVLDDLHFVDDAAIFVFLTRLVQNAPSTFHLVLITRVDPPLPLNRWRAQGHLHEVRLHDLSFTLGETRSFFERQLEMLPDDVLLASLHQHTEGWPVGIRLAALALRSQSDYGEFAAHFKDAGSRYIGDYLVDEVLDHQPLPVQRFLILTALLDRFCAGLCAAVAEIDERSAQRSIEDLVRANLFVVELSTPVFWYRYHHQFQSMLLSRLHERYDEQTIASLHRLAAQWLADHNHVDEALRHLIAIPDYEAAADLIEARRVSALNDQRFLEMDAWINLIPAHVRNRRPFLLVCQAWLFHYRLENTACLAAVQHAFDLLNSLGDAFSKTSRQLLDAEILTLRMILNPKLYSSEMLVQVRQAWDNLRPNLANTHSSVLVWLSAVCQRLGDIDLASEIALTTFEEATGWPDIGRGRLLFSYALNHYYECNIAEAERMHLKGLRFGQEHRLPLIVTLTHFGLASIARHRSQTAQAERYYLEVVKNPFYHHGRVAGPSVFQLLRLYAAQGEPEQGRSLVEQYREYASLVGRPYNLDQAAALEAYYALISGDTVAALRWEMAGPRGELYSSSDLIPLVRAHILIAEGSEDALNRAADSLQKVIDVAQAERRWTLWIDATVLQAVVWHRLGEAALTWAVLGAAVQKAVPNGVVGAFIEQGEEMERMLRELGRQPEYAQLVRPLINTLPRDPVTRSHSKASHDLPVPLTDRETEVLRLLAERLSNKEIAHRLVVSTHTVRNHTANIFGKLQVENRVQAVVAGRELGLIPSELERAASLLRVRA